MKVRFTQNRKYLFSSTCDAALNGAKILIDFFFFGIVVVVTAERSIIGLTGTLVSMPKQRVFIIAN